MAARLSGEEAREFLPVLRALREAGLDPTVIELEDHQPARDQRARERDR